MPQTKNEIAKALYKQGIRASANTIAQTAESLGIGNKIDYSDEEVAAIAAEISRPKESQAEQPPQPPQSEQYPVQVPFDRDAAKSLVQQLQTESHQDSQSMVVQAVDSLNRAEAARSKMLDMLSDRKAYLTDPVMFWAELEQLTRQKRIKPATEQQSVEAEVIELADSFSTALDTWKYPQITPNSAMGALPAY